jgi:DNA-binding NtrC family response regulator
LRALESREIRRLGSQTTRRVTFRLVSATNRDLVRAVEEGGFRADLFHRLAVLRIALPPLRERPEDIEAIARRFVAETELGRARKISDAAMMRLRTYPWPGNVRELLNVLRASLSLSESLVLDLPDLPGRLSPHDALDETHSSSELPFKQARDVILESFEADYLARVLRRTGGNVSEAARQTGLHRKTIERMARRLGLDVVMLRRES